MATYKLHLPLAPGSILPWGRECWSDSTVMCSPLLPLIHAGTRCGAPYVSWRLDLTTEAITQFRPPSALPWPLAPFFSPEVSFPLPGLRRPTWTTGISFLVPGLTWFSHTSSILWLLLWREKPFSKAESTDVSTSKYPSLNFCNFLWFSLSFSLILDLDPEPRLASWGSVIPDRPV